MRAILVLVLLLLSGCEIPDDGEGMYLDEIEARELQALIDEGRGIVIHIDLEEEKPATDR